MHGYPSAGCVSIAPALPSLTTSFLDIVYRILIALAAPPLRTRVSFVYLALIWVASIRLRMLSTLAAAMRTTSPLFIRHLQILRGEGSETVGALLGVASALGVPDAGFLPTLPLQRLSCRRPHHFLQLQSPLFQDAHQCSEHLNACLVTEFYR